MSLDLGFRPDKGLMAVKTAKDKIQILTLNNEETNNLFFFFIRHKIDLFDLVRDPILAENIIKRLSAIPKEDKKDETSK